MVEVPGFQPDLAIQNSIDPDDDAITYDFEVYFDEAMTSLVATQPGVLEAEPRTLWAVSLELDDNTWYYWRVRATDGAGYSVWAYGSFFVNTQNDPPGAFNISSPAEDSEVDTQTPILEVTNSVDIDEDGITYAFEIYGDPDMIGLAASVSGIVPGDEGSTSWT